MNNGKIALLGTTKDEVQPSTIKNYSFLQNLATALWMVNKYYDGKSMVR